MGNNPLVSVVVMAYRNSHLIRESLDSVLCQDYENMELIVSDDCSDVFDREGIADYIRSRNRGNITRLLVNRNDTNLGTVKHQKKVIALSRGRYLKFVAADDALYDNRVIGDFVEAFEKTDAPLIVSQVLIYDETMTRVLRPALSEDQKHKLRTMSAHELYRELVKGYSIRGVSLGQGFNRTFFDRYDPFDEQYRIDEDRSMWLRITRLGCPIHFMDRITAKYRFGGISTGGNNITERSQILYNEDLLRIFTSEILPFKEILGEGLWREMISSYLRQYEWPAAFSPPAPVRFF